MIIGITGTNSAGKGTIVDYLIKKGFKHYSVRDFLIEKIEERGLPINRENMRLIANQLREVYSSSYIIEELYKKAKIAGGDCIIESIRTLGEVAFLKEKPDSYLISVDADIEKRYERAIARKSETDKISFEEFKKQEEKEMFSRDNSHQNLSKCMELADFKVINNGTIEELEQKVQEILNKIYEKSFEEEKKKNIFKHEFKQEKLFIKEKTEKRKDYLSWDEYFMGIALLSAQRSKDPSTQVGACIVNNENKIIGIGYNGFPIGCSDDELPWAREGDFLNTKYAYVVHAELNAILNSGGNDLHGCRIYVAIFPCNECAKAIIQSGIKKVIYLSDKYINSDACKASRKMFDLAGVSYEKLILQRKEIKISFEEDYKQ